MRDKISNAMAASSFLAGTVGTSDESELAGAITDEMTALDSLLDRFHLILNYDNLTKMKVDLAQELREALRRISRYGLFNRDVELVSDISKTSTFAPPTAMAILLESILRSHHEAALAGEPTRMKVIGNETEQGTTLRLMTRCERACNLQPHSLEAVFSGKLATMMQIGLSHALSETDQTLTTTIKLPA
jgi:hypothetical protein